MDSKKINKKFFFIWLILMSIIIPLTIYISLQKTKNIADENETEEAETNFIEPALEKDDPIFFLLSPSNQDNFVGVTTFCIYNDGSKGVDYFAIKDMESFLAECRNMEEINKMLKESYSESVNSDISEVFMSKEISMEDCRNMYKKQASIKTDEMEKEIDMSAADSTNIFLYGNILEDGDMRNICYIYELNGEKAYINNNAGQEIAHWIMQVF